MYLSPDDLRTHLQKLLEGRAEIERELGRGGMGIVFLGRQTSLDRPIAIKVLQPHLAADPELLERFAREARTQSRLDHPNIVPIYDVFSEGGLAFYLMSYVDGLTLRARMDGAGALPLATAVRALSEIGSALAHAHAAGVVHRDVKPENILIDPRTGRMMLTDFGIAKITDGTTTGLTKTFTHFGSPRYMPPEQAESAGRADGRSDQYALAMVGYEMVAGRPAFDSPNPAELLYQHKYVEPPDPAQFRPDAPRALCDVLLRAISKKPEDRFPSMEEFVAAVEAVDLSSASAAGAGGRARRSARREPHRPGARPSSRPPYLIPAAIGGGVIVLATVLMLATRPGGEETAPPRPASTVTSGAESDSVSPAGPGLSPVAELLAPPTTDVGQPTRLDGSTSRDPDGPAAELRFRWDFDGDGAWDTDWSNVSAIDHAFASAGSRTVSLQVRDGSGDLHTAQRRIRVLDALSSTSSGSVPASTTSGSSSPAGSGAVAVARPASGPLATEFVLDAGRSTDVAGGSSGLRFRWDFDGDGSWDTEYSEEPTARHRFDSTGKKRPRVEVRSLSGDVSTAVAPLTVQAPTDPVEQVNEVLARFDRAVASEDLMTLGRDLYGGTLPDADRKVFKQIFDAAEKLQLGPSGQLSFQDEHGSVVAKRRASFTLSATGEGSSLTFRLRLQRTGDVWRITETRRD